jgi:hypothetical protein
MEYEQLAFAWYRHFRAALGFGDIRMVVESDPMHGERCHGEEVRLECDFKSARGTYRITIARTAYWFSRIPEEGVKYDASAEAERVKLQLADKAIGIVAANA